MLEESPVEDEFRDPEPLVLFNDLLLNCWRDLNLGRDSLSESKVVHSLETLGLETIRLFGLDLVDQIVSELVVSVLVNKAIPFIDQDVSVFSLLTALCLRDLLHGWVVRILANLSLIVLILSPEGLIWDVLGVEVLHKSVVEFEPATIVFT